MNLSLFHMYTKCTMYTMYTKRMSFQFVKERIALPHLAVVQPILVKSAVLPLIPHLEIPCQHEICFLFANKGAPWKCFEISIGWVDTII